VQTPGPDADTSSLTTVLFTDIVDSTARAAELGDRAWAALLEQHHDVVRRDLRRFGGREMDTSGDGFFAIFREPTPAVACARALVVDLGALGIEIRCGLHAGDCLVVDDKCTGLAVHIGARLVSLARPGEILASESVRAGAGPSFAFVDRGVRGLRGVPGRWSLYAVAD
jgi:class 3 adenylate cyclase